MSLFSKDQRLAMDAHLRACTLYNWDAPGPSDDVICIRTNLIDNFEYVLRARRSLTRDLVLPHSFILVDDSGAFWQRMLAIASSGATTDPATAQLPRHHTSIYGDCTDDARCVLTCPWAGHATVCLYTKWLRDGPHRRELRWMVRKHLPSGTTTTTEDCSDDDSAAETESESIEFY
jgi:hypothetical protein